MQEVIIRTNFSKNVGLGHLYRCLKLANELKKYSNFENSLVFFISPKKINKIIPEIKKNFSGRKIVFCREISKMYEEFIRKNVDELELFAKEPKGELTIVISEQKLNIEQNEDIILYGNPPDRGAVIPFNLKNIHPHDLAKFLDLDGICIRAGHHCAQPIMDYLKVPSTARISMNIYNDENDIDHLLKGIEKTIRTLN